LEFGLNVNFNPTPDEPDEANTNVGRMLTDINCLSLKFSHC